MTLIQVIARIREIVADQRLIKSFYFGDISNWSEFAEMQYTSCVLTLNGASFQAPLTTFNFSIWISDRLDSNGANRDNILSDTVQIIQDVVAIMNNQAYRDWKPETNNQLEFFEDMRGNDSVDMVAGTKLDFSISTLTPANRCFIPTNSRSAILTEEGLEIFTEDGNYIAPE
jgi:hypothetical protein